MDNRFLRQSTELFDGTYCTWFTKCKQRQESFVIGWMVFRDASGINRFLCWVYHFLSVYTGIIADVALTLKSHEKPKVGCGTLMIGEVPFIVALVFTKENRLRHVSYIQYS